MGFEHLSDDIEWEARRIATAFGMEECEIITNVEGDNWTIALEGELSIEVSVRDGFITGLDLGRGPGEGCELFRFMDSREWNVVAESPAIASILVRGLYRLGFEGRGIFSELPPLTSHEQMELRLNFPYEFWPQKWLNRDV